MSRVDLTVYSIVRTGVETTAATGTANDAKFSNNGRTFARVTNSDASARTITFQTAQTVNGLAVADLAVEIPAGETRYIGPFPKGTFDQVSTDAGSIYVDFEAGEEEHFAIEILTLPA